MVWTAGSELGASPKLVVMADWRLRKDFDHVDCICLEFTARAYARRCQR